MRERLTPRQREALVLKANGNTNRQAAAWMGIKHTAVSEILSRTCRELGASDVAHAVAIALIVGEIQPHQIVVRYVPKREAA